MGVFFNIKNRWEDTVISTDQIYIHQVVKPRDLGLSTCHFRLQARAFSRGGGSFFKNKLLKPKWCQKISQTTHQHKNKL